MYDLSDLCRAITFWLNYKQLTGLNGLFSESSLVVPIAEFLKTKSVPQLRAEISHPMFEAIRGRPRQIDFVGYDKKGNWKFVIESKFLPSTMQSIVNDLARLVLINELNCERFMVIALQKSESIIKAYALNMNVGGKRVNVLKKFFSRTQDKARIINIKDQPNELMSLFRNFLRGRFERG
jgi:hypothetical protein